LAGGSQHLKNVTPPFVTPTATTTSLKTNILNFFKIKNVNKFRFKDWIEEINYACVASFLNKDPQQLCRYLLSYLDLALNFTLFNWRLGHTHKTSSSWNEKNKTCFYHYLNM
jgi:hypothetical protein